MDVQSSQLKKNILEATRISAAQGIPYKLGETIMPVISVSPNHNRVVDIFRESQTTNNGATLYTTPATGAKFFLTHAHISRIKDAASNNTDSGIGIVMANGDTHYLALAGITLTAQTQEAEYDFTTPIELKQGQAITSFKTLTTLGVERLACEIAGYLVLDANG